MVRPRNFKVKATLLLTYIFEFIVTIILFPFNINDLHILFDDAHKQITILNVWKYTVAVQYDSICRTTQNLDKTSCFRNFENCVNEIQKSFDK